VARIALIPGEDAAPEAFEPTVELLERLGLPLEWLRPPVGEAARGRFGSTFPDEARRMIDAADTTLFGATSGPSAAALFYLRWGKQTYANVRPARWLPGARSPLARPEQLDLVIVRENLEDLYVLAEGDLEELAPARIASGTHRRALHELGPGRFAVKVVSEAGSERVVRFAFELARRRRERGRPGRVACGTKHNMLPRSDGLFREVALRVAEQHPDVPFASFLVDDLAHRLVARPGDFDVVVLPNLYGDVLSDAAAALAGGLGLAPSGCYGEDYAYFESAHGSAPDIAGRGIVNPTATILSAAMMLEHLRFGDAARALERAVAEVYAEGRALTPDQGGSASTRELCAAVAARL
jgi:isocitrate/isopropylmalate dehydrogenase